MITLSNTKTLGQKGNLTEPVQVEEGDVKDECKFVTRGIGAVIA